MNGTGDAVGRGVRRVRTLVRAALPDALVARVRLHRYSREFRTNVDVVLPSTSGARRWLGTTPDTYRVVTEPDAPRASADDAPAAGDVAVRTHPRATATDVAAARRALARDPGRGLAVVAEARIPRIRARRRVEPEIAPLVTALRGDVQEELQLRDGPPGADLADPVAVMERARDAGHRMALLPRPWTGRVPARRHDPVTGPASVVVLALVPLHDVGGGSRGAQLTRELLRRGAHVVYAPLFGSAEPVDLGIRLVHPRLEQRPLHDLDPDLLAARTASCAQRLVLVEAPAPSLVQAARTLGRAGMRVVYDLVDDWTDPDLGGAWYDRDLEAALAGRADVLVASAPRLAAHLERLTDRRVHLIPNGVDPELFAPGATGPTPADLPRPAGPIVGYHGSMYGGWFDWERVRAVAVARPDAAVVLIGTPPRTPPALPDNVHLLGLRAQADLPAYVARFDVGLVPFRVDATTHAVSPLKVYEYLACGVPVAAPPLESLAGLAGVHVDWSLPVAVDRALAGPRPDAGDAAAAHGWEARVERLAEAGGLVLGPRGAATYTARRAPVRYARAGRRPRSSAVRVQEAGR